MSKRLDCRDDQRNVSMFICDTDIFRNVRSDKLTTGNPWFSSFLVSSKPYQGYHDRNHKFYNIVSTILHYLSLSWMFVHLSIFFIL